MFRYDGTLLLSTEKNQEQWMGHGFPVMNLKPRRQQRRWPAPLRTGRSYTDTTLIKSLPQVRRFSKLKQRALTGCLIWSDQADREPSGR